MHRCGSELWKSETIVEGVRLEETGSLRLACAPAAIYVTESAKGLSSCQRI